ncbi:unnamed protein product [Phytomonas sp. EM1]|nr:unnamed protein product [Phytomonas sp. EM1]|eukprot:CCW59614.1 unnamed protein product [Phytomonas sp. isolate EM1]
MSQPYIALGSLLAMAVTVVFVGAHRLRKLLPHNERLGVLDLSDAFAIPLNGSVTLLSMYVLLRLLPKEYFIALISLGINILATISLKTFMSLYLKSSILAGTLSVIIGTLSFLCGNWIASNILAFVMGISAIETIVFDNFFNSFVLLICLFFYDIFWVFGSDAMITVASGIDGPIKLVFPNDIFGDHSTKSLLGLGDLVVPGIFISQTLIFSRDFVKRGNFYFNVAIISYTISLANTMAVMIYFHHGQPALLFIVPWLLITFCITAWYRGDLMVAFKFNIEKVCSEQIEKNDISGCTSEENLWDFSPTKILQYLKLSLGEEFKSGKDNKKVKSKGN